MSIEITLLSAAFITGLFGSVHCIGMCGGIMGILTMGLPLEIRQSQIKLLIYLLVYNFGRLGSYMIAGIFVGWLSSQIKPLFPPQVHLWMSGLFMIILGLYLTGWLNILIILEKMGNFLWQKISPLGKRLLPVTTIYQALGLGLVWGWLPCGLVYTALALSLASGSASQGGLLMLIFGLGTLPMLLVMGTTVHWLTQLTRQPVVRRAMGTLIILFGIYTLLGLSHPGHYSIQGTDMCYF